MGEETDYKKAFILLKKVFAEDGEMAWAWHCNLAMPMQDAGMDHETSNKVAAQIMRTLFNYDTSKIKYYQQFIDDRKKLDG